MFPEDLTSVATKLVEFCNKGEDRKAVETLYHADAASVEAAAMGPAPREVKGVEAILGKHDWWNGAHEVHSVSAAGPFLFAPDRFNVLFSMDVTNRESGRRMQMQEVATYHVQNGRIVREEFAYSL